MKMTLSLIALALAGVASACDVVSTASYQTQAVAASPCQTVQSVSYAPQQVQFARVAQPQYAVQQVRVVQVAQPVYQVRQVQVVQQQKFVAVQNQGYGRVSSSRGVRAGGGFGSNALNSLVSPQGILSIAGAVGGAAVAGPVGAGLGSALGNFIGGGLR